MIEWERCISLVFLYEKKAARFCFFREKSASRVNCMSMHRSEMLAPLKK
jgi:hypothetical protein